MVNGVSGKTGRETAGLLPEQDQQDMAQSVRYGTQMSGTAAQISAQTDRYLGDPEAGIRKTSDHFRSKLHAGALKFHCQRSFFADPPQPAVKVGKFHTVSFSSQP